MKFPNWKWRIIISFGVTGLLVFYLEIFSYVLRSHDWVVLPIKSQSNKDDPLRILIVADPQIQGELDEIYLLGIVTRWDADKYLKRTFHLAKHHVKPHVIIFLGDLFDEGVKASESEYQRYLTRFTDIFDLPNKNDLSTPIKYIFVPGDNDVGGEKEPVSETKLSWFNQSFGNYNDMISIEKSNWDVQFMKYNKFFPKHLINPLKGVDDSGLKNKDTFRLLISHFSVLRFISEPVQEILDSVSPSLILSAHNHQSNYYRFDHGTKNSLHTTVIRNFLLQNKEQSANYKQSLDNSDTSLSMAKSIRFHINQSPNDQSIHEINVPTCSYRMGTTNIGYGALHVFQNGTVDYTILWSLSRFRQLYIYEGFYILMKLIFSPWILWTCFKYFSASFRSYQRRQSKTCHSV